MWDDETLLVNNQSTEKQQQQQQYRQDDIERQAVHFETLKRLLKFLENESGTSSSSTSISINDLTKKNVAAVVELMKKQLNAVDLLEDGGKSATTDVLEECCWILLYESKLNPSFKKGVARLFQALECHPDNIPMHRAACAAIRNVVEANPDASERIAPHSQTVLLQSITSHQDNTEIVGAALGIVALLKHNLHSSLTVLALQQIVLAIKHHFMDAPIQAIALCTLANTIASSYSSTTNNNNNELSQRMDVRLIVRSMRQHVQHPNVQRHGCCTLRHLSTSSSLYPQIITAAGGMEVLLAAMKQHGDHPLVQEHALVALYHLLMSTEHQHQQHQQHQHHALPETTSDSYSSPPAKQPILITSARKQKKTIATTEILSTVLEAMKRNEHSLPVQAQGLQVLLVCVTSSTSSRDSMSIISSNSNEQQQQQYYYYEWMVSEGGLDVILTAMANFPHHVDCTKMGCVLLKNVSQQSMDFQRTITAKNGISVVLTAMRRHIHSLDIQDAAFGCIRNLCAHQDNRRQLALEGAIPTLAVTLTVFLKDAAIQAYGCDALGRLAKEPDLIVSIEAENGIGVAMEAMAQHPGHPGVQDRACFLLFGLSEYRPALLSMTTDKGVLPLLLKATVPAKKEAVDRLNLLIRRVERVGKRGWFGRPL